MTADFLVLLDACVLANFGVCDLFLRLAEHPRLYVPRWSDEILKEVRRTQREKLNWPEHLVTSWHREVPASFPDASIAEHQTLLPVLANDEPENGSRVTEHA